MPLRNYTCNNQAYSNTTSTIKPPPPPPMQPLNLGLSLKKIIKERFCEITPVNLNGIENSPEAFAAGKREKLMFYLIINKN